MTATTTANYSLPSPAPIGESSKLMAANVNIPLGSYVGLLNGYAVPAADTASLLFWGQAQESKDNGGGSAGALSVLCQSPYENPNKRLFGFYMANPVQANIGAKVYVLDNQTVGLTSTNSVYVGRIDQIVTTGPLGVVIVGVVLQ